MKTVIFSHAHPNFSKGGGELAAYYLWQGLNDLPDHEAWFLGRADQKVMHQFTTLATVGERDYLLAGNADIPDLTATTPLDSESDLAQLLKSISPDVVHFHHYVHVGIETIRLVKNVCPSTKIFVTLHEYIAICMHNGQMIKTNNQLCHRYNPRECHLCFPHVKPEDFFLREQYIKSFFRLVNRFISPSEFLRQRYIDWGIHEERISVVENGLPEGDPVPLRELSNGEVRGRFAYFGQINPYKGIDVIIEAFSKLPKDIGKIASLDIYGSALESQTEDFQKKIRLLLKKCSKNVRLHGAYEPEELSKIMEDVDWVVMGSIWWENSPLVIQEAFKYKRPIICPDIGGMAEKVNNNINGLHFRARDSTSLSTVIVKTFNQPGLHSHLTNSLGGYSTTTEATLEHIKLYCA